MEVVYPLGLISRESGVRIPPLQPVLFQDSTAVVQLTVNQLVVGSIPTLGASIKRCVAQLVECVVWDHEVGSSKLSTPTRIASVVKSANTRDLKSLASACGFDSRHLHHSNSVFGGVVLMGTHLVCNQKLRVRFSPSPPLYGSLAQR